MKIIEGNLFEKAYAGEFSAIAHGCNCQCTAPYSGIAATFEKHFQISEFPYEQPYFKGKFNKLGNLDYRLKTIVSTKQTIGVYIINAYTQFNPGRDLNKVALLLCFQKLQYLIDTKNLTLGIPLIGGGIAGGDPKQIYALMKSVFKDNVTLVIDKPEMFKLLTE